VRGFGIVTHQFQRIVGFDGGADVDVAIRKQWPAAMTALSVADIPGELAFGVVVDLPEIVVEHDVFGGDGRIGLELEHPMPVVCLARGQPGRGFIDDRIDREMARRRLCQARFSTAWRAGIVAGGYSAPAVVQPVCSR
jgi:hypothetical protein